MRNKMALALAVQAILAMSMSAHAASYRQPEPRLEKHPVFLFCPHRESVSSWSLYVIADRNNPAMPLSLGLEELTGKNSKDNTYKGVLKAQWDPATKRNEIARLDASDFGRGTLDVKENNMLSIGVTVTPDGLKLTMNARVGIDQYFMVGGAQQNHRNLLLKYSNLNKCWQAKATTLETKDGRNVVGKYALPLTGIVFTASAMGVSRIAAVDDLGSAILLMDK